MIILEPCAGLGNRILATVTAYDLAKKYQHELILLWSTDGAVGAPYEAIFEIPEGVKVIHTTNWGFHKEPILRGKSELIRGYYRKKSDVFLDREDIIQKKKAQKQDEIEKTISKCKNVYIKSWCEIEEINDINIFSIIKPSKEVCELGMPVFHKIQHKTYGMHIRRTDHEDAILRSPLELFLEKAAEILGSDLENNIFLATDDIEVEREMKKRFDGKIVCQDNKVMDRNSIAGIRSGFIDMLALSKCKKIYGSYGSTFSQIAAYIGGNGLYVMDQLGEMK